MNSDNISNFASLVDDAEMRPLELGTPGQTKPLFVGAFFHAADKALQTAFGASYMKLDVAGPNDATPSQDSSFSDLMKIREGSLLA